MIVVSDATSITTLLKAGEDWLLRDLFGSVLVPGAVREELLAFHAKLPAFVSVREPTAPVRPIEAARRLGRGETEALALAQEIEADLLLTDDRQARTAAVEMGLRCSGLLGLVVRARRTGRIQSAARLIEALETRGGLYLSAEVKAEALRLAGEEPHQG